MPSLERSVDGPGVEQQDRPVVDEGAAPTDEPPRARLVLPCGLLVAACLVLAALSWLPTGDLVLGQVRASAERLSVLAPQGWGFFTKSPRGSSVVPYMRSDGGWTSAARGPNSTPASDFGWDRSSRLTEFDVQQVLDQAGADGWTPCEGVDVDRCLDALEPQRVEVRGHDLRLCGRVGLVRREPLPWLYRDVVREMPAEVRGLDVRCTGLRGRGASG